MMNPSRNKARTGGYTLVEVLVGILIFAVGMMALAQLQGNLAKNSGDANARTVATNVAEEIIESRAHSARLTSDDRHPGLSTISSTARQPCSVPVTVTAL